MKNIWKYFVYGCVAAILGVLFSDLFAHFFNGMEYGSACILSMGMYLCIVIVTYTGIIVSKIGK